MQIKILSRFSDLNEIIVDAPIQDIQQFLTFLKSLDNIVALEFSCKQSPELFERLPEHCAVKQLVIFDALDLEVLLKFKQLIDLEVNYSIDEKSIEKVLELEFITWFKFYYNNRDCVIGVKRPNRFEVWVEENVTFVSDVAAAIQAIPGKATEDQEADLSLD